MEIKQYTKGHHKSCVEIYKSNTPRYFTVDEWKGLEIWLNGQDEGRIAYKNTEAEYFYVIGENGAVVGCGGFYVVTGALIANLVWGMVHSSFHNQGLGKKLFEYRIGQIKLKYPQHHIILDTTQHTYKFFEKQGFSIMQIRKDFYDVGLHRYDMMF